MKKIFLLAALLCSVFCQAQSVYVNGFSATSASPSDPPSTIDPHLSYSPWTISAASFTSFAGASGQALSMSSASATTNTWTLPLTVASGYGMALTSFSFWDRASATGYTNWQLDVNGTVIGTGTISSSGASTGTISITGTALTAVSNLSGSVNVHLVWSGGTHGGSGTGRLDNFTLNGTLTATTCTGTPAAGTATASTYNICTSGSSSLTLSGAAGGSGISYQWQSSADGTAWANISAATNTTYTTPTLTTTAYYNCVTTCSSSGLSSTSNTETIAVVSPVTPSVSITSSASTVCSGTSVTYTATPVNGGTSPVYQWQVNGASVSGAVNATYSYAPANGDVITCVLTSSAPCASPATATSNSLTMTVNPTPSPTISGTTSIMPGASANITFTGASGDIVYYWDGAAESTTISGTTSVVSVSPTVTTTYSITSATSTLGCTTTISGQTATVTVISSSDTTPTRDDNMAMGNPSSATTNVANTTNYLMVKSQYTLSYNATNGMANWVSWHLSSAWLGDATRCDCYTEDATLPSGYYRVSTSDYTGTGFDRGHLCPSADRTGSDTDNKATFLMTNMTPQAPVLNEQTWENLEDYCRSLVSEGKELYIIAGGIGNGGSGSNGGTTTSFASGHVNVPAYYYKIVVVLPVGSNDVSRVTTSTVVIAVIMPNNQSVNSHSWDYYRTSVDSIESLTGYNFLSNVPDSIQAVIEANASAGPSGIAAWDFTGANSVSTFAATTYNAHLDTTAAEKNITRGSTSAASAGSNSFRTTGFKNNGISTSNTDYFQTQLKAQSGYAVSLTSISPVFQGTSTFYVSPGVTSQFAYSLDGTTFTLIDTPVISTSLIGNTVDLSGITALQNVPATSTITLRYYASGQTSTGGWGFYSSSAGNNGLTIAGTVASASSRFGFNNGGTVTTEHNGGLQFTMQPNPAIDEVGINFSSDKKDNVTIRIVDMSGRCVYTKNMGLQQSGSINVSLKDLVPGVYLTELISGGQRQVKRLVKE